MKPTSSIKFQKSLLFCNLKTKWERICRSNNNIKPVQHYDYVRYLYYAFYANYYASRWRIVFYYLTNDKNECIIPLVVNDKKRMIRGLSNFGRLDYEDVISSTDDSSFVRDCLKCVLEKYIGYEINLINVNENSTLYKALGDRVYFRENCVCVDFSDGFDDYYAKISKHQRQNIRTAYNKLAKEEFEICLKSYDKNTKMPRKLWTKCQQMYEHRHDVNGTRCHIWLDRQKNPYTHILHSVEGWRIYVLFHGDIPISYMAGIMDERQLCCYVPRLCIDKEFVKYSPGIVLLMESIKRLINQGVTSLDLMLGDEPYKIAMGGRIHKNYELKCLVDDLL